MKVHKPAAVEPHHYDLPAHVAKLILTDDFKAAARAHGTTPEHLIPALADEVKAVVADLRAQQLAEFESYVGIRALSNLIEKLKAKQAA
jgi:hypothetical protein